MTKEGEFCPGTQPHRYDGGSYQSSDAAESSFLALSPLEKLRWTHANRRSNSDRRQKLLAITDALSLSEQERKDSQIAIVVAGEHITSKGLLQPPQSPFSSFVLYVAFPLEDSERKVKFVKARSRDFPEPDTMYSIVNNLARADSISIRKEESNEKHTRLLSQIKYVDSTLEEEGPQYSRTELQALKRKYLLEYLQISAELKERYRRFLRQNLAEAEVGQENVTITMRYTSEMMLNKRLFDPDALIKLQDSGSSTYRTSLDREQLFRSYREFLDDPRRASVEAAQCAGICQALGLSLPEDTDDAPVQEQVEDVVPPIQDTVQEEVDGGGIEPERRPLTNRQRRQLRKGAKREDRVSSPPSGDEGEPTVVASFAGINKEAAADETDIGASSVEKPAVDDTEIIRAFLEADETMRQGIDTRLIVLSIDSQEMLYFPFQGRLLSASREDLAAPGKPSSYWDEKVTAVEASLSEQPRDTYNWLRTELARVETLTVNERTNEQQLHKTGDSSVKEQALQASKIRLRELTLTKKVLLLSYLQTAEALKKTSLPLPWIPMGDHSDTHVHLSLRSLSEEGKDPIGEVSPGIDVTVPLISHRQRQRRSPDDIDAQIAALLVKGQSDYRKQQERQSVQLRLEETLQQLIRERNPKGREAARTFLEKGRLAMRDALTISPDDRARLRISFIVLAPLTEDGELEIEDPELSQYDVYMFFGKEKEGVFYCSRTLLAKDPDSTDFATRETLEAWDQRIKEHAVLWDEGLVQGYNRQLKEIDTLEVRMRQGNLTQEQSAKRLPLLKSAIHSSYQLLTYLSGEGYGEDFGEIFFWEDAGREALLHLHPIGDHNLSKILLGEDIPGKLYRKTINSIQIPINYQEIWEKNQAFDRGNKSLENQAAAFLCNMFNLSVE